MVKAFKQEIPGEWLDLYRKVFGEPVMAGVSYKWGRDYGYEGYQIGTHVPEVQPPVQGVVGMKISAARKSGRLFLMSVATVWGFQTDTGTATFAYSGACDQEWWDEFFLDVAGNKWQKFVGATWVPLGDYGFVLWGDPAPPVAWNVVWESLADTVTVEEPWDLGAGHWIAVDSSVVREYSLVVCAGSRRVMFKAATVSMANVVEADVRLVLEKGPAWWDGSAVCWNNMPGGWTEVERWAPGDPVDEQAFMVDACCSYRLRFAPETVVRVDSGQAGFALVDNVTLYGHA